MTQAGRSWVWRSTKQSRDAGQLSILAVAETVFAVAFYWWLALYIDTAAMLVISPIVAFMVLLRSPQSVEEGKRLYLAYDKRAVLNARNLVAALAVGLCIAGAFLYSTHAAVSQADTLVATSLILFLLAFFTLNLIIGTVSALLGVRTAAEITMSLNARDSSLIHLFLAILLSSGAFAGLAVRALLIRTWATVRYLGLGVRFFSLNWLHLTLKEDFLTPPVLVPGLPEDNDAHFLQFFKDFDRKRWLELYLFSSAFPLLYLPASLYRITLKSTAWLYLPLIWMAHIPASLREAARQEVWIKSSGRNWIGVLSAAAMLVFAIYLAFDRETFTTLNSANETQPLTPFHMIWALDPAQWALWFWVTVPLSTLTIALWVLTNRIGGSLNAGGQLDWHSMQLRGVIILNQIKNALVIAWIVITFLSVARLGWLLGKLPEWMRPAFEGFVLPVTNLWAS